MKAGIDDTEFDLSPRGYDIIRLVISLRSAWQGH